jgi:hypothetical protein
LPQTAQRVRDGLKYSVSYSLDWGASHGFFILCWKKIENSFVARAGELNIYFGVGQAAFRNSFFPV